MSAKEYLSQIKRLDTLIQNKTAEKRKWEAITMDKATVITASTEGERVQSSGSKQKMADTVDSGVDRVRRIEKRIKELYAEMDAIIAIIDSLPEDKSDILHKVYVQYMSLKEVAAIRHESYSTVTTNHGIALKMVSNILREKKATTCN
jgi:DNA-directed RNA polymerase specialized sigma24 family protein